MSNDAMTTPDLARLLTVLCWLRHAWVYRWQDGHRQRTCRRCAIRQRERWYWAAGVGDWRRWESQ